LFCCAVIRGFDGPLATDTEPVEFGLTTMIVSASWVDTVQPAGSGTVAAVFDAEVAPGAEVGGAMGLGDVPGVGLGRPATLPPTPGAFAPRSAIAVPQPAITRMRTKMALMIRTHGVRCTAA
jgi:hypothetical protein